jgi:lipoprotein NlpD
MTNLRENLRACLQQILLTVIVTVLTACSSPSLAPVGALHTSASRHHRPAVYRIRKGDTLFSISFQYGLDYRQLAAWNGIRRPYTIYAGQSLRLTPSRKHRKAQPKKRPARAQTKTDSHTRQIARRKTKHIDKYAKNLHWRWPAKGRIVEKFSRSQTGRNGIDIAGRAGQSIKAAESGKVVYAGGGLLGYGKLIIIKHNDVYLSAYAHNRRILVKEGQRVISGQRIAEMGKSGTDSVKLHFEIRQNGRPVNPQVYLPG